MHPTPSPIRKLHEPVVDVLVVAARAPERARLAAHVWQALPAAQVHELSQLNDLVYRVAGSRVDLVVLDAELAQALPLTPLLVQMLKGIRPALRIVCVAQAEPLATSAITPATDASLTEACLGGWLRTVYGHGGASSTVDPPAICPS